ncbi:DEAD/DEAH box helicase [uncultured Nonlabens sp.]|uniref:DEAD/DEAH box helicase n=1 Tax=uncultured Nonlabens sp. TaxID=859306 RepID=UPI00260C62EB|nr:DEAD/DEAH box helicase [uncultured Nonlabens sp.]
MTNPKQIPLFSSLFKGREDVFALRWEKSTKSGYMPAYSYDPYMYRLHKQHGGTFKDYTDKTYLRLNDYQLSKHFSGEQSIGIYPLLKDNTSWFIVADFDKGDWKKQSQKALQVLKEKEIPSYVEQSRSGNGAHVWIFFDQAYPAIRSRKIVLSLFEQAEIFSVFDKNTSFDRLFPNQDYLSGKGLGNLIALPLQGNNILQGNSCFINPETFEPYTNQWDFIKEIQRVPIALLNQIYNKLQEGKGVIATNKTITSGKLQISLTNCVTLSRNGLEPRIIDFLKEQLNFYNSDFIVKKKMGKSTWKTERYFNLIEEKENSVEIPSGFVGRFIRFCKENNIDYNFSDQRKKLPNVTFSSSIELLSHQHEPLSITSKKDFGIIVAPPGAGKTIMGLKIIEQKEQPALIITHRKQIAQQWITRIETFFGNPKREIGSIGQGKTKVGKRITVALIQTLTKKLNENKDELKSTFGIILIDECHHIPAKSFRDVIHQLSPYYQYGLTATPFRKNNDEKLLFLYLGDIIAEVKPHQIDTFKKARLVVRDTNLEVPFNSKTDHFETLFKVLIHDSERNKLILKDIYAELKNERKIIIITERVEHIEVLYQYLKSQYEVIAISGKNSTSEQNLKWKSIQDGNYQAIITTGQYFGEGTDIKDISCLFLVYPFAFKGKLIQYIGRVQRSELKPITYDYRDKHIPYLNKLFLKRNTYYRNLDRQATLFEDFESSTNNDQKTSIINKTIRVAINDLDFHYGLVCFSYKYIPSKEAIQFEIENEEIQPEFEVLKPYFSKTLQSKFISVHIQIETDKNTIVSQLATSEDIDKINKEIIESVKFQFIEHNFIKGRKAFDNKIENSTIENHLAYLVNSDDTALESILNKNKYLHSRHLHYLAKHHDDTVLKIRYVLHPFSFVFILTGEQKFHIVLETLDTKEATYVWHCNKDTLLFKKELKLINEKLNLIRTNGRQAFLETKSENFSKIIHDYNDSRDVLYKWKNALEERMF